MNKDTKIYLILGTIVILVIVGIYFFKNQPDTNTDESVMKCIASKTLLYSSPTCPHCIAQKKILGNYSEIINTVDCLNDTQKCVDAKIGGTPTWIINGNQVQGVQSISELKRLTGC